MLSVIMLSVVILSVVLLSAMAPFIQLCTLSSELIYENDSKTFLFSKNEVFWHQYVDTREHAAVLYSKLAREKDKQREKERDR